MKPAYDTIDDSLEENTAQESESKEKNQKPILEKIKRWYRRLPDKKQYLEFITALLTIPVLLTVIISNVRNLEKQQTVNITPTQTVSSPTPTSRNDRPLPREPKDTPTPATTSTPTPTPSAQCKKEIGPVSIVYPEEGITITKDPVCLDISRTGQDYCSVVWSYRINAGSWSDYTDKSICIYGLTSGTKNLDLRVKSIVTGAEIILTRTFSISTATTPTPTSTSSATLN